MKTKILFGIFRKISIYLKKNDLTNYELFIKSEFQKTVFKSEIENTATIVKDTIDNFMISKGKTVLFEKPFTNKFYKLCHQLATKGIKRIAISY